MRRPLEAVSSTESGPSRGVCLGLGRWTLDAGSIRPCCVESSPYGRQQPGKCDDACRRSSVPVRTSSSVTCTLPCRLAESHNFSPPPSPAIAVPATFSSLPRLVDARAGRELATTLRPREYSLSLTVTQNEHLVDPRGEPAVLCFGYRLGTGVPPWGPPPHPGPAVHSDGKTALHSAAMIGNRRIVRSLVDANAGVNAQNDYGCAVCACGESADECAGRVPAAVGRAGGRRCTLPRTMATPTSSRSCCCAAPTGPFGPTTGNDGAAPHSRNRKPQQPRARRHTPKQWAEWKGKLAEYEAGERQVHSARRLTTPAIPPASRPIPPNAPCSDGCAVGARRSSGQEGNSPRSTRTVTSALAARLVVHLCTRWSKG